MCDKYVTLRDECFLLVPVTLTQVADGATLERLDAQIEEDPGLDEPALEELRSKRRQKARNITDTNGRLKVPFRNCHRVLAPGLSQYPLAKQNDFC